MAKPKYAFEKRQRDMVKKQKKEEKRLKKSGSKDEPETEQEVTVPAGEAAAE